MATIADLKRRNHSLGLYCIHCNRWSEADLDELAAAGLGDRKITNTRFRCRDCGGDAEKQVRPPVPSVIAAEAYI